MNKYKLLMFCILIFTQGCSIINTEDFKIPIDSEYSNTDDLKIKKKLYTLTDFTKIKIGMSFDEVIKLIGEPTDSVGSGVVWQQYELEDGWYVNLLFFGNAKKLINLRIVDYSNNRIFELKQQE